MQRLALPISSSIGLDLTHPTLPTWQLSSASFPINPTAAAFVGNREQAQKDEQFVSSD
jgi:hypothetical protein